MLGRRRDCLMRVMELFSCSGRNGAHAKGGGIWPCFASASVFVRGAAALEIPGPPDLDISWVRAKWRWHSQGRQGPESGHQGIRRTAPARWAACTAHLTPDFAIQGADEPPQEPGLINAAVATQYLADWPADSISSNAPQIPRQPTLCQGSPPHSRVLSVYTTSPSSSASSRSSRSRPVVTAP